MEIIQVIACHNILGEGPLWDVEEKTIYWVDIDDRKIQRFSMTTNTYEAFNQPLKVGVIAKRAKSGFICGTDGGLHFWQPENNQFTFIAHPEAGKKDARFNDGKVDRKGRFWVGTMTPQGASSALYRLNADLKIEQMVSHVTISNGIGWSPDNHTMYHAESMRHTIFAYDFNLETGEIANRRVFAQSAESEGVPDGLTVDSEGYVWCAIYDGWKLVRFDPLGQRALEIPMPVARPSSCAFGGDALNLLFVTTISEGLGQAELEAQPLAGDLFVFETDFKGLPEPKFEG